MTNDEMILVGLNGLSHWAPCISVILVAVAGGRVMRSRIEVA